MDELLKDKCKRLLYLYLLGIDTPEPYKGLISSLLEFLDVSHYVKNERGFVTFEISDCFNKNGVRIFTKNDFFGSIDKHSEIMMSGDFNILFSEIVEGYPEYLTIEDIEKKYVYLAEMILRKSIKFDIFRFSFL